ncbi:40725_t:CDS:2, partial [Gigaspora margarita]
SEMHALFIRCRNLDDAKANGIIKKFLKFFVLEMGEQIFEDAASKLRSNFIEWRHTLWNRISKLFVELQKRAKRKMPKMVFFNLNNDLYTVNLNVLTLNGWNVAISIDLSKYHFNAQKGADIV